MIDRTLSRVSELVAPRGAIRSGRSFAVRPIHAMLLGIALIVLVPDDRPLGPAQASVPRVATLIAVGAIALGLRAAHARLKLGLIDLAMTAYLLLGIASWRLGTHPPGSLRNAANFLTPLAFYPAARYFGRRDARPIAWTLLVTGALASLTVYYEAIVTRAPLFVAKSAYLWNGGGGTIFRPGGLFESPPVAATILAMTSLCGLSLVTETVGRRRLAAGVCVVVSVGGMLLTFTRGSIIGFVLGLIVFVVLARQASRQLASGWQRVSGAWRRTVIGAAAALVIILIALSASGSTWFGAGVLRHGTFSDREAYWTSAWPLITNSPRHLLIGHGINSLIIGGPDLPGPVDLDIATVPELSTGGGPHSQYVRTLLEEGFVGLALLLAWLVGSSVLGARSALRTSVERPLFASATGALVSLSVASLVDDTLRNPPTFAVAAVIAGLVVGRSREDASGEEDGAGEGAQM